MAHPAQPYTAQTLTRAMARRQGIDLATAVFDGWFTRSEFDHLIAACTACGKEARCSDWLSTSPATPTLPAYCANKSGLEGLRL
ncbi:MAG: DUF6455 family protein [Paracoccaceae bacterium]